MPTTLNPPTAPPSVAVVSTVIDAPASDVWAIVGDPTKLADFSPENVAAELDADLGVGSTFTGRNAREGNEWSVPCTVTEFEPGTVLAYHAGDDETGTTWRFELRALDDDRTQVVQSFDSLRLRHPDWIDAIAGRHAQLVDDMRSTLNGIKHHLEEARQ